MAIVLAFANQKGGTGKTTTAVNVAAYAANANKSVLLVDLDPQGNATSGLGVGKHALKASVYDVLTNSTPAMKAVCRTRVQGLDLLPSNMSLVGAELELVNEMARENRLKDGLAAARSTYDYIFVDCPPSLGLLTVNAFAAADGIIVPMQCEYYALEGLSQLINSINLVKRHINPSLNIFGVVLTMYDPRLNLTQQVETEVKSYFGDKVFSAVIPRNIRLSEAPSHGLPICLYDGRSKGAESYMALTREIIRRGDGR
ncbi:MAG TPA: ParA family protein [Bacillota bacterium]|nr:MAG: Sporulation initiation inhibitor protein Soj [Firmicutes bacterium ADurb.Bin153]HNV35069.1 ParA family protein [Bacillota bacterium]HPU96205.1 ParA family protein [Bacillota bacterium]